MPRLSGSGVTYIIEGGGFSVSGNASLSGTNVLIDNTTSGSTSGSISLSGNGTFSLSRRQHGPDAGVLIYQPARRIRRPSPSAAMPWPDWPARLTPRRRTCPQRQRQSQDTLIVDTLSISGNAIAQLTAASGGTVYTRPRSARPTASTASRLDGTGQTIAIVDAYDDPQIYQALDAFDSQFGLTTSGPTLYQQYGPATSFLTVLNQNGQATSLPGTDPIGPGNDNWEVEEALDVEWAHAIAPGAKIILVEANSQSLADLMAGAATAASQPGVSTVSMSWGFAEGQGVSGADEAAYDSTFAVPGRDLRGQHGRLRRGRSRLPRLFAQRVGRRRHEPLAQRRQLLQQRNRLGLSSSSAGDVHRLRRRAEPIRIRAGVPGRASSPRAAAPRPTFPSSPIRPRGPGSPTRIISIPATPGRSWAARVFRPLPGPA